ncbi:MAG TPA: ferrous iron transport protein A [Mycobacteriales bacterium]|nr:ferrous iron transport protein A [Mycobacteriales bacterium]
MPGVRHTLVPLQVGTRVVLRYSLAGDGSPPWTDALGELVAQDDRTLTVATRSGPVVVARAALVAAKPVPPAPPRRPR